MGVRVVVVQHGEKEAPPGDPGLTVTGREQAAATARWLASRRLAEPVAVWSSPIKRAVETAAVIAAAIEKSVRTDVRLRERMNWDGTTSLKGFLEEWTRASVDR